MMTTGTLDALQLPASLHAVDSVADVFHDAASRVGTRVYGHSGGLTVRERYLLAERREAYLKRAREASIQQRERQRKLRGELVRVEKTARRMVLHASRPCGREGAAEGTTHSIVASIKGAGTQRSACLAESRDADNRGEIAEHVDEVRAVMGRMKNTFDMARVRRDLRAAITAPRRGTPTQVARGTDETVTERTAVTSDVEVGTEKAAVVLLRRRDYDLGIASPRQRHLRRRAAICLQRHARGRPLRKKYKSLVRPALHVCAAEEQPRVSSFHKLDRRAILLARFKGILDAYSRVKTLLTMPLDRSGAGDKLPRGGSGSLRGEPPGEDAASSSASGANFAPRSRSGPVATAKERARSDFANGGTEQPEGFREGAGKDEAPAERKTCPGASLRTLSGGSQSGASGKGCGAEAVDAARREAEIVVWALRDVAARVLQEEIRLYARRRRALSGSRKREESGVAKAAAPPAYPSPAVPLQRRDGRLDSFDASATTIATETEEAGDGDEDGHDGGHEGAGGGGLPWAIAARLATADYNHHGFPTTATSSSRGAAATGSSARTRTLRDPRSRNNSWASASPTTIRSSLTATSTMTTFWRSPYNASPSGDGVGDSGNDVMRDPDEDLEEWRGGERSRGDEHGRESRAGEGMAVRWPLLPGEERKKRRNEANLRRNVSRLRHNKRGLVALECRGCFVLPEIIKMQRLFRARTTRRMQEQKQAYRADQQAAWDAKGVTEREERAARWKASMSRLKVSCLRTPQKGSQDFAAIALKVAGGNSDKVLEDFQQAGSESDNHKNVVLRDEVQESFAVKDAPYASAHWSLAVAFDVGSWRGGLRQRYYFGRMKSFLNHRRGRKAALRARVETRMILRLQTWAALLSRGKRSFVCETKARAPAEVVGAHLRFLARKGTWEGLLLDLHQILETAIFEREEAMDILSGHVATDPYSTSGRSSRMHPAAPTTSLLKEGTPSAHLSSNIARGNVVRPTTRDRGASRSWAAGSILPEEGLHRQETTGGIPPRLADRPSTSRKETVGFRPGSNSRSRAEDRRQTRLRGIVDGKTLRRLHPWVVALLAGSGIQFVPSVPQNNRVGYRMHDANKMEILAETQLTRRYWRFLDDMSSAILCVGAAKVEALTLAAEAGELALLLGFAHHLTSTGRLDPPCNLPKLPPTKFNPGASGRVNVQGVMAKHADACLAPVRRQEAERLLGHQGNSSTSSESLVNTPKTTNDNRHRQSPAGEGGKRRSRDRERAGESRSMPKWYSADKHLCENCWAMRIGASAAGGSKCQRCGRTHRRGYSQGILNRGRDGAVGPVPWQQMSQVAESVDLFVVHAAFACILHPGSGRRGTVHPADGGLGWWNGGNPEEIWWRAVCGGKQAAKRLHDHGLGKVGSLYAYAHGSGAAASTAPVPSSKSPAHVRGGSSPEKRARTKKLQRLVKDDDLAIKISSLLLRLMSAFEELRVRGRWPSVPRKAIDHALRCVELQGKVSPAFPQ